MDEQRDEDLEELTEEFEAKSVPNAEKTMRERDELEDDTHLSPWAMAAIFAGLVVLAAIICAVLWHFTHLEGGDAAEQDSASVVQQGSGVSSVPTPTEPLVSDASPIPTSSDETSHPAESSTPEVSAAPTMTATPPPTTPPAPAVSPTPTPTASATPTPTAAPSTQTDPPVQEPVSGTTAMAFASSDGSVTPKDVINLRSEPSTLNTDNIVAQAKNGDILQRTGINEDTGWTRIDYNGQTLYAVTQYLTTDLSYQTPVQAPNPNRVNTIDGRVILFTDLDDNITPKEYVNLRTEPSTTEGDSTVRCQVSNGEVLHRTGYSPDAGWSRVEYNGETLYVVSSYVYTVE